MRKTCAPVFPFSAFFPAMSGVTSSIAHDVIARILGAMSTGPSIRLPLAPHERANVAALKLVGTYFKQVGAVAWEAEWHAGNTSFLHFMPGVILADVADTPTPAIPIDTEGYRCACDARFATAAAMRTHIASAHMVVPGGGAHVCRDCQRAFETQRLLLAHDCTCTRCDKCGRTFETRRGLISHRAHAHRPPPYKMSFCSTCRTDFGTEARRAEHTEVGCPGTLAGRKRIAAGDHAGENARKKQRTGERD
jgi:hypothetical protein